MFMKRLHSCYRLRFMIMDYTFFGQCLPMCSSVFADSEHNFGFVSNKHHYFQHSYSATSIYMHATSSINSQSLTSFSFSLFNQEQDKYSSREKAKHKILCPEDLRWRKTLQLYLWLLQFRLLSKVLINISSQKTSYNHIGVWLHYFLFYFFTCLRERPQYSSL